MTARVGHRGRGVAPKSTVVSRERAFIGVDVRAHACTDGRTDGRTARSGKARRAGEGGGVRQNGFITVPREAAGVAPGGTPGGKRVDEEEDESRQGGDEERASQRTATAVKG